jgi:hypothetical protein
MCQQYFFLVFLLIAGSQAKKRHNKFQIENSSILFENYHTNYCDLRCNNQVHTLCKKVITNKCVHSEIHTRSLTFQPTPTRDCQNFEIIKITEELQNQLLSGHNGLRNRFARVQNVGSMRILEWDEELARMAEYWANSCEKYALDPCTQLDRNPSKNRRAYFVFWGLRLHLLHVDFRSSSHFGQSKFKICTTSLLSRSICHVKIAKLVFAKG